MVHGKKYKEKLKVVDRTKTYDMKDALSLLKKTAYAKFDETIDLAFKLNINTKKTEQNVRGTVLLPEGSGKNIKILVFAKGEKLDEAKAAGADFVGSEELIEKVAQGFLGFDKVIATPDIMAQIGKLGKTLGTRGLMPNPKSGTVTFDVAKTVKEFKGGRVEFKSDKGGCVHMPLGKLSFDEGKILSNLKTSINAIVKAKPAGCKGGYIKSIVISSTMGPGIKLDVNRTLGEV